MPRRLPPRPANISRESETVHGLFFHDAKTSNIHAPIYLGTTFLRDENYQKPDDRGYIRDDNPTLDQCSAILTNLEGGYDTLLYPSGAAASAAPFLALQQGQSCLVHDSLYYGLPKWLNQHIANYGIGIHWLPSGDDDLLEQEILIKKPNLVWLEIPSNPMLHVLDITRAAKNCQKVKAILCIDSTNATPVLTRPLDLGADFVIHSATKFLNGHNDVLAGALITKSETEFWLRLKEQRFLAGWMLDSFSSYLLVRGLKTLFLRVIRQSQTAQVLAEWLTEHPKIIEVRYPGLSSHPNYAVAKKQMNGGFGGLMSLHVKGGADGAIAVCKKLRLIQRATSLGGTESLAEHRYTAEGGVGPTPPELIRFSVGLEQPRDLINDWKQALDN